MNNLQKLTLLGATANIILIVALVLKKKIKRKKKCWSRAWLQRRQEGKGILSMLNNELLIEDKQAYRNFLRLTSEQFETLLNKISDDISKQDTCMRDSISARSKLEVTLRFLATGETFRSLMYSTRIHETTISKFIIDVCNAIYRHLEKDYMKTPNTVDEWQVIARDFNDLWQFPHCLGAIDGRHITFRPPRSDDSYYYNYKGDHSIVLLGVSDANYKFIYVNVGCNGRVSDGGVFRESQLSKAIQFNYLHFPPAEPLPGRNMHLPFVFVADDAFPLWNSIMKPYPQRGLSHDERIYNYRLSRARRIIENAFGILANRFRVLLNPISLRPSKVEQITLTCVALHNYLATENGAYYTESTSGEYQKQLQPLVHQGGNRSSNEARKYREEFRNYFCSNGIVPWQEQAIERNNL